MEPSDSMPSPDSLVAAQLLQDVNQVLSFFIMPKEKPALLADLALTWRMNYVRRMYRVVDSLRGSMPEETYIKLVTELIEEANFLKKVETQIQK